MWEWAKFSGDGLTLFGRAEASKAGARKLSVERLLQSFCTDVVYFIPDSNDAKACSVHFRAKRSRLWEMRPKLIFALFTESRHRNQSFDAKSCARAARFKGGGVAVQEIAFWQK